MRKNPPAPASCPVCGEDLPRNALACPECGADYNSGWRDDAAGLDAEGGGEFDYEEFAEREFGHSAKPSGISRFWWITAIVLLLGFVLVILLGLR